MSTQTIYALSTVFGKSGVAVFRISGEKALKIVSQMTKINTDTIKDRYAYFCNIYDITSAEVLDKALVIYFKAPHSFTGEDIVEIHSHGSKAVISSMLDNLSSLGGFRLAEAGEFSKRAFYNNKMDLTEAEGLADLIDSETREQQRYALQQMDGGLKNIYDAWREGLVKVLAHLEAYIDFPDEDIPEDIVDNLENGVFKIAEEIKSHLSQSKSGERLRDGFRVVIVGEPNAGKSSLLNALAKREAVIVSDIAGTTRDAIDVYMDINGYPVIFTDTAGIRDSQDVIEIKGIEIARNKATQADFIIALFDASNISTDPFNNLPQDKLFKVANKVDKISADAVSSLKKAGFMPISAKTQEGVEDLLSFISGKISTEFTGTSGLITRQRYRESLNDVFKNLSAFNLNKSVELAAEDIRLATRGIGKITGRIEVDEILDKIFSSFCIGK